MPFVYILYSEKLNKYYIGCTADSLDIRLNKHLAHHIGFTSKAKDWAIVYTEQFETISEARKRELQLKKWKSALRIRALIEKMNGSTE